MTDMHGFGNGGSTVIKDDCGFCSFCETYSLILSVFQIIPIWRHQSILIKPGRFQFSEHIAVIIL